MKLLGFPPSPNTWKVRAVAAHIGTAHEFELIDLTKPRSSDYLALNPTGRTPTLIDGDFVLWESNAIMQHLAGQKPTSLWPNDARTRADISRWLSWQLAHWGSDACQPLIFQHVVKKVVGLGAPDAAVVERATAAFNKEAKMLDGHLAKQPYLVGSELTLADFAVAAPLFYANDAKMPVAQYPHLQEWFGRVSALPAWRQTAPQRPATAA